jgi:hypothetical protein
MAIAPLVMAGDSWNRANEPAFGETFAAEKRFAGIRSGPGGALHERQTAARANGGRLKLGAEKFRSVVLFIGDCEMKTTFPANVITRGHVSYKRTGEGQILNLSMPHCEKEYDPSECLRPNVWHCAYYSVGVKHLKPDPILPLHSAASVPRSPLQAARLIHVACFGLTLSVWLAFIPFGRFAPVPLWSQPAIHPRRRFRIGDT